MGLWVLGLDILLCFTVGPREELADVKQLVIMVLAGEHLLCRATRCSMCVGLSFLCEISAVNFKCN